MTTVAFDGNMLACDTMMVDGWGTRDRVEEKVWVGNNVMIGFAGPYGKILKYLRTLSVGVTMSELLYKGYPSYNKDDDDPSLLLVNRLTGEFLRTAEGTFHPTSHKYWAIGSGRDYALAAMYLGKSAKDAVLIAAHFDYNTNTEVQCYLIGFNNEQNICNK
jgi:ATP-dependent protease HslVU (ClpYQ) peptidase subunit